MAAYVKGAGWRPPVSTTCFSKAILIQARLPQ
jgi:hypothetical protein